MNVIKVEKKLSLAGGDGYRFEAWILKRTGWKTIEALEIWIWRIKLMKWNVKIRNVSKEEFDSSSSSSSKEK